MNRWLTVLVCGVVLAAQALSAEEIDLGGYWEGEIVHGWTG